MSGLRSSSTLAPMRFRALRRRLDELRSGLWLVPTVFVVASAAGALALIAVDRRLQREDAPRWIYRGGPANASDTLTTIASSMITFTGLVFSITIVALQLASSQFSPRVLRTFLRDRQSQVALGVFVATFTYAFVALTAVRVAAGDDPAFVPSLTVTGGLVLVAASIVVFVRFIHHTAHSLRVVTIIEGIARETRDALDAVAPREAVPGAPAPRVTAIDVYTVCAPCAGSITDLDLDRLADRAARGEVAVEVLHPIGTFVCEGQELLRILVLGASTAQRTDPQDGSSWLRDIRLGPERSMRQDPAFGFRQLVDIAERALSPGVNDPTTAVQCLDRLHDLLRDAATRPLPAEISCVVEGTARVWAPSLTFGDLLDLALDELRHWGSSSLQVHRRVDALLDDLLTVTRHDAERHDALLAHRRLLHARRSDLPLAEVDAMARRSEARGAASDHGRHVGVP